MHFIYLVSFVCALPLSSLEAGFQNRALPLQKRGPPPTPEQLAELKAAKEAKKAAQAAANADPAAIAAKKAKQQADLEKQRLAQIKQAEIKAEKTRQAEEALKNAQDKAAKDAAEKAARKAPAKVQPANTATTAHVIGQPDPVKLQFSEGFVDKHINGGVGSGIGKEKTVILEPIKAFAPGTTVPNPKGTGQRLTLTSQHSVNMKTIKPSPSGRKLVETTGRGRVTVSGQQLGSSAVIDHFEKVVPSRSSLPKAQSFPKTRTVTPTTSGLSKIGSVMRRIRF